MKNLEINIEDIDVWDPSEYICKALLIALGLGILIFGGFILYCIIGFLINN